MAGEIKVANQTTLIWGDSPGIVIGPIYSQGFLTVEEVLESWSLIWFVKDLTPPLLALKVEEEAISQGMSVALGDGKSKETDFPLEPEERNTAVLTLLSVRNHSQLLAAVLES